MIENYIGIDAGGTKTIVVLVDADLRVRAKGSYEGMNLAQMNPNTVSGRLKQIIEEMTYRAGMLPYHVGLTVLAGAGGGDSKMREEIEYACWARMPERKVKVITDAEAALAGAFKGGAGIVLIAGTGSIAWGKDNEGRMARAGGYGYILGDEGSGFWMGREVLRRCLDAYHRGEMTALGKKVCEFWQIEDISKAISIIYSSDKPGAKAGELAPLVFEAYEAGDAAAQDILREAGRHLAELAVKVRGRLSFVPPVKVCLSGGVAGQQAVMQVLIGAELGKEYELVPAAYEAAVGAVAAVM